MILISGTLEGAGPNKGGTTTATIKDFGFSGRAGQHTASPPLRGSVEGNGPNKGGDMNARLTSAVDASSDVTMYPFPEGTAEDGGPNA